MSTEQLEKILKLEIAKGYADTAVSGGLDKYLARLPMSDYEALPPPSPSYKALNRESRVAWVSAVLSHQPAPKTPVRIRPHTPRPAPLAAMTLDSDVSEMKGVRGKMAERLAKLGIKTVRDLIYFFPRRHVDYSQRRRICDLEPGMEQTVIARVWQATQKKSFKGMRSTEAIVGDETGTVRVIWFNQPYLAKKLTPDTPIALSGQIEVFKGQRVFQSPEYEIIQSGDLIHTGRLVPVYPLTSGLYPRQIRQLVKTALDACLPQVRDFLPREVIGRANLPGLVEAIQQVHYPDSRSILILAEKRLAFDELFSIQLGVLSRKRDRQEINPGIRMDTGSALLQQFMASLPFTLTCAQHRVITEIRNDLTQDRAMSRLIQGDVGSGKTVVATAAMLMTVASGHQAALMAPTEILAEQHLHSVSRLLAEGHSDLKVALLTGSMGAKAKRETQHRITEGEIDIIIGTQALIQQKVSFKKLGLVVVDEQHRFGVAQRLGLSQKGASPHILAMSATPIPRTLALTLYGDLDISLIDELPAGRAQIQTKWLNPRQRSGAYAFVRKKVAEGRQAFIICPLVEESESIEAKAATAEYERLSREVFPDLQLGLLHGRMSQSEKEDVMRQFRDAQTNILVSTSVIEVGVDIPNATVMLIEGAERFGLSQLHQFRGRVFRGSYPGYCMLLAGNPTPEGKERLSIMETTHDGFVLAEEDLKMRGPGEFFGTRQSGLPDLKMARLTDVALLELARSEAIRVFDLDPRLEKSEHHPLAEEVARLWRNSEDATPLHLMQ